MSNNVIDQIFADLNRPKVMKAAKLRKSVAGMLAEIQKSIDNTMKTLDKTNATVQVTKAVVQSKKRASIVKLDGVTRRDLSIDATGDESLGTRSSRATGNVAKAEQDIDLNAYGGFASRSEMTGEN